MTEYSPDFARAGHFDPYRFVDALTRDVPLRHLSKDFSYSGSFDVAYSTLASFTVALEEDEVALVTVTMSAKLLTGSSATLTFYLLSEDLTITSELCEVGLASTAFLTPDSQTLLLPLVIQDRTGKIKINLLGKDAVGGITASLSPAHFDAQIFKRGYTTPFESTPDANLKLWLDAEYGVTTDSELRIASVASQVGSITATQSSDANKPIRTLRDNRENLITYSEDLSGTGWNTNQSAVSTNVGSFPGAGTVADLVTPNLVNSEHGISKTFEMLAGQSYSVSIYAKSSGVAPIYQNISIYLDRYGGGSVPRATFALSGAGSTSNVQNCTATIEQLEDDPSWYRCTITGNATNSGNREAGFFVYDGSAFVGVPPNGILFFGAQAKRSGADSDYVKTVAIERRRGINHRRGIWFDGTNHLLQISPVPSDIKIPGDVTFFAVLQRETPNSGSLTQYLVKCGVGNTSGYDLFVDDGNGSIRYQTNQAGASTFADSNAQLVPVREPAVIRIEKSGTTVTFYKNGYNWGSGTVNNPVDQTYYYLGVTPGLLGLTLGVFAILNGVNAAVSAAIEDYLMRRWIRSKATFEGGTRLNSEWLQNETKRKAARIYPASSGATTISSGTNNSLNSVTFPLEEDECALILATFDYKRSATDGAADFFLTLDGTLYNEKYQIVYDSTNVYHGALAAVKTDGNGSLVTASLLLDFVSGGAITINRTNLRVIIMPKR